MPCLRFSYSRPNKYYMLFNHYLQYNLFISAKNVLGNIIYYVCFFSFHTDCHDLFAVSRRGGMECKRPDNLT